MISLHDPNNQNSQYQDSPCSRFDKDQKGMYYIISIPVLTQKTFYFNQITSSNPAFQSAEYKLIFSRIFLSNFEESGIPNYIFLEYMKEIPASLMIEYFEKHSITITEAQITTVPPLSDAENEIKDMSTIYFYGGPKYASNTICDIIATILPKMKVTRIPNHESPLIFKVIPRSIEIFDRMYRLIPAIPFKDNAHFCATWSDHYIPVIFLQDDIISSVEVFRNVFSTIFTNMIDVIQNTSAGSNSFYVLFADNQSALEAIANYNYGKIGDKEISITHFFDKNTMIQMVKWRIKVKKFKKTDLLHDYYHYYSKYGVVNSVYIENKSIVSVQYVHLEDALKAFSQIKANSVVLPPLVLGLYIYEIPIGTKEEDLYEIIPNARNIKITPNDDFRPYASVFFNTIEERDEAQAKLSQEYMDGLKLQISPQDINYQEITKNHKTKVSMLEEEETTVFFPVIPPFSKREDIIQACKSFGNIESCRLISPKNPKKAVVVFADEEAFNSAINNGIKVKKLLIKVKKHNPSSNIPNHQVSDIVQFDDDE